MKVQAFAWRTALTHKKESPGTTASEAKLIRGSQLGYRGHFLGQLAAIIDGPRRSQW
jgi:hypothetical protein